jgi:formiminotetrahydrofolate cyclodeaminase
MASCAGIKRDGGRCTVIVNGSQTYCYQHDPKRAEERRRNASRAARSKPSRELADIKERLSNLADAVLAEDPEKRVDKGVAAVASQVLNVYLRAVSVELKAREQLELVERLEVLEETLARNKENRWHG